MAESMDGNPFSDGDNLEEELTLLIFLIPEIIMDVYPKWERLFYWIMGICSFAYAQWAFYRAGQDNKASLDLSSGWKALGGWRDTYDYEWACFRSSMLPIVSLIIGHLVLSHILVRLKLNEQIFKGFLFLYDTLAFIYIMGGRPTLLFLCEALLMYAASFQAFISVIWILGLCLTTSLNYDWVEDWQVIEEWHTPKIRHQFFAANAYLHLRLMSCAIDIIQHRKSKQKEINVSHKLEKTGQHCLSELPPSLETSNAQKEDVFQLQSNLNGKPSLIDCLGYSLYFPLMIHGPILTFAEFHRQMKIFHQTKGQSCNLKSAVLSGLRVLFWFAFLEFTAYFMYPNSFSLNLKIVSKLSVAGMIGFIMWQSLYFTMKYVCFFGIGSLACKIDGLSPPPLPRCTATLYRYTDIWKYFDVGYYNFIKKYIYIPLGGSQCGFLWQSLASISAFAFIYYWHGATVDIFLWAAGNWSVIAVEMIVIQLLKSKKGCYLKSLFTPAGLLRIRALLYIPCYIMSSVQITCFFFSKHVAYIMANVMVLRANWIALIIETACFYFNFQNAMYITDYFAGRKG